MISKTLIGSGTLIIVAGILEIAVGIISNYPTLGAHAGIGVLGPTFFLSVILVFVGLAMLAIGIVRFFKDKNRPK